MTKSALSGEIQEHLAALETGLADCAALADNVTIRGERMENKLAGLLQKLDMASSISDKMMGEVSSLARKVGNIKQMNNIVGTEVMQEMNLNTTNLVSASPPPSPTRQVSTKPLPSIRRLPTLPLLTAATAPHQGGLQTAKKTQNLGDFRRRGRELGDTGGRGEREDGRRVRVASGIVTRYGGMDRMAGRERRVLMEVMEVD